jgi:Major Facilitator Superfamily
LTDSPSSGLSDRLGRKEFLLAGLAVFGLASVAGGLTSSLGQQIVARCFMGLGAAMIFPATLSLISNVFTEPGEAEVVHWLCGRTLAGGTANQLWGTGHRLKRSRQHDRSEPASSVCSGLLYRLECRFIAFLGLHQTFERPYRIVLDLTQVVGKGIDAGKPCLE